MSLRGRHARNSVAPTFRFLIVTVGGTHFALHADRIQGLLTVEEVGTASTLTVQGFTYCRIDLATRLRLPEEPEGTDTRVILFSKDNARGNIRVAQVHGLKELEQSQVLPLPRQFQGEEQRWYQGMALFGESIALVLDPAWVVEGCDQAVGLVEGQSNPAQFLTVRTALTGGQV